MILDPDYARIFTMARVIAWQYGYACVAHGSYTRDLDLLLVPWTDAARANHDQLLKLIAASAGLRFRDGKENVYESTPDYTDKPHGRKACTLFFRAFGDPRFVDISIMPVREKGEEPVDKGRVAIGQIRDGIMESFPVRDEALYRGDYDVFAIPRRKG